MAAIMNPVTNEIQPNRSALFDNPNAPRIANPSDHEQACLDGYWKAVFKNEAFVADMQKHHPGWLPDFNMISI